MRHVYIGEFGKTPYRIQVYQGALYAEESKQGRFTEKFLLSEHATEDFAVAVTEKYLHCVCRTDQEVFYFLFDGTQWHKKVLATGRKLFRNLRLFAHGNFVHFLYTIVEEETQLLVHRLLGGSNHACSVVAQVTAYSAALHDNGDLTLLCFHEDSLYLRQFIWSQKAFSVPHPVEFSIAPSYASVYAWKDRIYIAGFASSDSFANLLCGEFTPKGETLCLAAIHLLSGTEEGICFSVRDEKLTLCWCENGMVMSAEYQSPGHWTSPMRYLSVKGRELFLVSTPQGAEISYLEKDSCKVI